MREGMLLSKRGPMKIIYRTVYKDVALGKGNKLTLGFQKNVLLPTTTCR